jgi:cation transport protein ChaC
MSDLWVFGYGSLMWRPGFPFEEAIPAQLAGAHRSLCVYSIFHRGSPRHPGLVLGLDAGGRCDGIAFRVRAGHERHTRKYLRAREQVTRVYREAVRPVRLMDGGKVNARALCFLVDNSHRQYAGKLPLSAQAFLVRRGEGRSGPNTEYVANTVRHLDGLGIEELRLKRLLPMVGIRHGALNALPCQRDVALEC